MVLQSFWGFADKTNKVSCPCMLKMECLIMRREKWAQLQLEMWKLTTCPSSITEFILFIYNHWYREPPHQWYVFVLIYTRNKLAFCIYMFTISAFVSHLYFSIQFLKFSLPKMLTFWEPYLLDVMYNKLNRKLKWTITFLLSNWEVRDSL